MTVTYGFYDSLAGDRVYNAQQISSIFDGIVADGIFQSIGTGLAVTVNGTDLNINVGIGRAWLNHTWTHNDAVLILTVDTPDLVLPRIDTVVLEVNSAIANRENSIKIINGTPASTPVAPTLAATSTLNQHPLANIYVGAGVTTLNAGNITNRIGTDTPFVTGVLETIDIDWLFANWESQFQDWFDNLVDQLSGSQVTNLQAQIDVLTALPRLYAFGSYTALGASVSANNAIPFSATLPSFNTDPKIWSQAFFTPTTNDGSNYWTVNLKDGGTGTILATMDTSALATSSPVLLTLDISSIGTLVQGTHKYIYLQFVKTGSPAAISVHSPSIEYTL